VEKGENRFQCLSRLIFFSTFQRRKKVKKIGIGGKVFFSTRGEENFTVEK